MSVASRVEHGLSLVAGGGPRAADPCTPAKVGVQERAGAASHRLGPRPALGNSAILSELFPPTPRDAGWTGFILAQLPATGPLLWVQERMAILEGGRVHAAGLGNVADRLIHVEARDAKAALWAMEEGLRCPALGAVIGELWGDPQALDFTATRRLAVAAEAHGVACWLVRMQGGAGLSGARERWRLASAPSEAHEFDPKAPGTPRWQAELFRSRLRPPGSFLVSTPLPSREREGDAAGGGRERGLVPVRSRPLSLLAARAVPLPQGEREDEHAPHLLPMAAEPADRALGEPVRRAG